MAKTLELTLSKADLKKAIEKNVTAKLEKAAVDSMEDYSKIVLQEGKDAIAKGGGLFAESPRFRDLLRVNVYPNQKLNAAIYLFHKIPYAGVFETGATLFGKPIMWLPIQDRVIAGVRSPKQFKKAYPDKTLRLAKRPGKPPLLVAKMGYKKTKKGFVPADVPIFVGLTNVTIPKKFDVRGAVEKSLGRFAAIYNAKLRRLK